MTARGTDPRLHRLAALAPLALGIGVALVLAQTDPPRRTTRQDVYRIAPGTADRVAAGLSIEEVLPRRLETSVGAALTVTNDDRVSHVFGPFVLAPGQSWSQRYGLPGDYAVACSLYPDADLVIAVGDAPGGSGASAIGYRLMAVAWMLLAGCLFGAMGLALAAAPSDAAGLERVAAEQPSAPPPEAGSDWLTTGAWAVAAGLAAVVAVEVVALSRLAPVRTVLASRALPPWSAAALAALGAALLAGWAGTQVRWRPPALAVASFLLLVAMAAALVPSSGPQAAGWALAGAGVGLILASIAAARRSPGGRPSPAGLAGDHRPEGGSAVAARLAVSGAAFVVTGLAWPAPEPAWLGARGVLAMALGGVVVAFDLRPPLPSSTAFVRWVGVLGGVLAVAGAALAFVALLWHIERGMPLG